MTNKTIIIAEAGVNHNGDINLAYKLIKEASLAGADYIKFQSFKAETLVTLNAEKAAYQKENTNDSSENQYQMLKKLELSHQMHKDIYKACEKEGIKFLSTPFDIDSLNYLVKNFPMDFIKLGSGEITNAPLLLEAAKTKKNIILSTGMSNLQEIEDALSVIGFGYYAKENEYPSQENFQKFYKKPEVKKLLKEKLSLLHCTTEYPTADQDINLRAMQTIKNNFDVNCGYSDHTKGIEVSLYAVAMGANIIEKHFTLDKSMPGPDHKASLDIKELNKLVKEIRRTEKILGSGVKEPATSEIKNINIARKGLKAKTDIKINDIFTKENLTTKRPNSGLSPYLYWDLLGKKAQTNYKKDEDIG